MIDLEDVDLAKALSRLSKLAARLAFDIPLELDSPELTLELAEVMESAVRMLRERAQRTLPKVVDLASVDSLSHDERLAAGTTFLAYQLTLVAQEIRRGVFDQADRLELADTLQDMAVDLRGPS
jgi:hypothetical protein